MLQAEDFLAAQALLGEQSETAGFLGAAGCGTKGCAFEALLGAGMVPQPIEGFCRVAAADALCGMGVGGAKAKKAPARAYFVEVLALVQEHAGASGKGGGLAGFGRLFKERFKIAGAWGLQSAHEH